MKRAVLFVLVVGCARLVGIQDYQPTGADGGSGLGSDAPVPCGSGWGSAGCITSIAAGNLVSCAVAGNNVYCWGRYPGNGMPSVGSPALVSSFGPDQRVVVTASSTWELACIDADDAVTCWGDSSVGQLQTTSTMTSLSPVTMTGKYTTMAPGGDQVCGIGELDGKVYCWGASTADQLGGSGSDVCDGTTPCSASPVDVGLIGNLVDLAAGDSHTCAMYGGGTVYCWGANSEGQLGIGVANAEALPLEPVVALSGVITAQRIAAGSGYSCALAGSGVACWGANSDGQGGGGSSTYSAKASFVSTPDIVLTAIAVGASDTCAIDTTSHVWCWGDDTYGVAGSDAFGSDFVSTPVQIEGIDDAVAISVGFSHACAQHAAGGLACWGDDSNNELGVSGSATNFPCNNAMSPCSRTPVEVPPPM